jgi:hypothetical protein
MGDKLLLEHEADDLNAIYDVRGWIEEAGYGGIKFAPDGGHYEDKRYLPGVGVRLSKGLVYTCLIDADGNGKFVLKEFLPWLAIEIMKRLQSSSARVVAESVDGFYLEHSASNYSGSVKVLCRVFEDRMHLAVEFETVFSLPSSL